MNSDRANLITREPQQTSSYLGGSSADNEMASEAELKAEAEVEAEEEAEAEAEAEAEGGWL